MGHMRHHAIVVTSFHEEHLNKAFSLAQEIFNNVTPIVTSLVNGYYSFMIPPDGSKEGWAESKTGDESRVKWKKAMRDNDLYCLTWAEVQYGDDERETKIVDFYPQEEDEI